MTTYNRIENRMGEPPGTSPRMEYQAASGLWLPVSGSPTTGYAPLVQADGSVAWGNPSSGGGGGSGDFYGPQGGRTVPPSTGWSWFNQRGSTESIMSDGSIHLNIPIGNAGTGTVASARVRTAPSTPYTIVANIDGVLFQGNYHNWGLCFGNAGSEIRMLYYGYVDGVINIYVAPTSGGTAGSASYGPLSLRQQLTFLAIRDDGTNKKYYIGTNPEKMVAIYSEARTAQFTPTQVGWFGSPRSNTYPVDIDLFSWKVQTAEPV